MKFVKASLITVLFIELVHLSKCKSYSYTSDCKAPTTDRNVTEQALVLMNDSKKNLNLEIVKAGSGKLIWKKFCALGKRPRRNKMQAAILLFVGYVSNLRKQYEEVKKLSHGCNCSFKEPMEKLQNTAESLCFLYQVSTNKSSWANSFEISFDFEMLNNISKKDAFKTMKNFSKCLSQGGGDNCTKSVLRGCGRKRNKKPKSKRRRKNKNLS